MEVDETEEQRIRSLTLEDIVDIMRKILARERQLRQRYPSLRLQEDEQFWMIGFSEDWQLIFIEAVGWGLVEQVLEQPTKVFSFTLQKEARHLVLCHHKTEASLPILEAEKASIARMIQVGALINTPIWDYLVISTNAYVSFKEEGVMTELNRASNYVLSPQLQEQLIAQLLAAKEKNVRLDIAKALKQRNMPADFIAEITKLSLREIDDLE